MFEYVNGALPSAISNGQLRMPIRNTNLKMDPDECKSKTETTIDTISRGLSSLAIKAQNTFIKLENNTNSHSNNSLCNSKIIIKKEEIEESDDEKEEEDSLNSSPVLIPRGKYNIRDRVKYTPYTSPNTNSDSSSELPSSSERRLSAGGHILSIAPNNLLQLSPNYDSSSYIRLGTTSIGNEIDFGSHFDRFSNGRELCIEESCNENQEDSYDSPILIAREKNTPINQWKKPNSVSSYASSESSMGSPPPVGEHRHSLGGGALISVGPTIVDLTIQDDEVKCSTSPDRKQYVHKNGGGMVYMAPPSNQTVYSTSPISDSPFSPTSDYSSAGESEATTESSVCLFTDDSLSPQNEAENLNAIFELIEDCSATSGSVVDPKLMESTVDEIIKKIEENPMREEELSIPMTVLEQETACNVSLLNGQLPTSGGQLMVVENPTVVVSQVQPIYFVVKTEAYQNNGVASNGQSRYRPIIQKPEKPITNSHKELSLDVDCIYQSIITKYPEQERQTTFCTVAKLTDEEVMEADDDGDRKLHIALINHQELYAVRLINLMARLGLENLDIHNKYGQTPLLLAIQEGLNQLTEYLLAKGADPNAPCLKNRETVLHYVVKYGHHFMKAIESLGKTRLTDMNAMDGLGQTPLMCAVECHGRQKQVGEAEQIIIDSLPVIRYLMNHGASIECQDRRSGDTAIHIAIKNKNLAVLKVLCNEFPRVNKAVNITNYSKQAPLHYVAGMTGVSDSEQLEYARVLLKAGACPKIQNSERKTPGDLVDKDRKETKRLLHPTRQR